LNSGRNPTLEQLPPVLANAESVITFVEKGQLTQEQQKVSLKNFRRKSRLVESNGNLMNAISFTSEEDPHKKLQNQLSFL
jgi:hypothetical protein